MFKSWDYVIEDLLKRIPFEEIEKHEVILKNALKKVNKDAELTIAGSYRRRRKDSGDIDVLITSKDKTVYTRFVNKLKKDAYLIEDLAFGRKKYNGVSKVGRDGVGRRIDIMYTLHPKNIHLQSFTSQDLKNLIK